MFAIHITPCVLRVRMLRTHNMLIGLLYKRVSPYPVALWQCRQNMRKQLLIAVVRTQDVVSPDRNS